MKKRILSILLMSAMLLGMTGCNSGTEAPESTTTKSAEATTTTTAAKEDTVEATKEAVETEATTTTAKTEATTTTTTTTEEIVEETVELPLIKEFIYNSLPIYSTGRTADNQVFVYNAAEKSIYLYSDNCELSLLLRSGGHYFSGDYLKFYSYDSVGSAINYKNGDRNLEEFNKDGEYENFKLVSKDSAPFLVIGSKEDFSGKVNYYGIIDENGEWLLPMTSTEIDFETKNVMKCNSEFIAYNDPTTYEHTLYLYYYKEDKTVAYENNCIEDGKYIYGIHDEYFIVTNGSYDFVGTYTYNIETGELTTIHEKYPPHFISSPSSIRYENGVVTEYKRNYDFLSDVYDGSYTIIKYNYDLSEYDVSSVTAVTDKAIVFNAKNPNGTRYRLIMKKDGTLIGEPVESEGLITYILDNKILSITESGKDRSLKHEKQMIDIETGEVTDISADYVVDSVIENEDGSCKLLVKSNNTYYYVEPTNFEKLVNVFEGVENVYTVEE